MNREEMLLDIKIQLEALITKREGMVAENLQHQHDYGYPKYLEKDFNIIVIDSIVALINETRSICHNF